MIPKERMKTLCSPPGKDKAYFRPFICKGDIPKADIFLVGTNPATPIYPNDLDIESYIDKLYNYDSFIKFYKQRRIENNKSKISRTRIGMNSFIDWLSRRTYSSIIETDIIPYPTEKLKTLKLEPHSTIKSGKEIFYEVLTTFKPSLIILHGKETVEQTLDLLLSKKVIQEKVIDLELSIEDLEQRVPLISIKYSDGKTGVIVACRHFMYYGSNGNSFSSFRDKLNYLLSENRKL